MVWIYIGVTLYLLESCSCDQSESTKIVHHKLESLALALEYYRYIVLSRDQVFFVQFLLTDMKHDTGPNSCKTTFYWLVLAFNIANKSLKKSHVRSGKLQIDPTKKEEDTK